MPAGISTSENAEGRIPLQIAGTWRCPAPDGRRWNEYQNQVVSAFLDPNTYPVPIKEPAKSPITTTQPLLNTAESSSSTSSSSSSSPKPTPPAPFYQAEHTRQWMMMRKYTKQGMNMPTGANMALWKRCDLARCTRGLRMNGREVPGVKPCQHISVETGAFCDMHSCIAIADDGYRCPNEVTDPKVSRICDTGYHRENNRHRHLDEALAHRVEVTRQEEEERNQQAAEIQRQLSHLNLKSSPSSSVNLSPARSTLHFSSPTSSGTTTSEVKTPKTPVRNALLPEIDPYWKGDWTAVDWKKVESGRLKQTNIGLGLKVNVEEVKSGTSVVDGESAQPIMMATTSRSVSQPPRVGQRSGSKMARLMTERFGNGYVRKHSWRRSIEGEQSI